MCKLNLTGVPNCRLLSEIAVAIPSLFWMGCFLRGKTALNVVRGLDGGDGRRGGLVVGGVGCGRGRRWGWGCGRGRGGCGGRGGGGFLGGETVLGVFSEEDGIVVSRG